ncbi:hypothetical protein PR202_gb07072 [Eleusine coracana subsp. coracana]|uniref:Uncharacterized protein n=1 Tax=Eleusine coracana subsp. coracana TaxID=191504 RepID=A0AAV5EBQ4_ELECO|nr:hypothetical protein PR202_gb07072 [Eleusine coracana subsp. coracana]
MYPGHALSPPAAERQQPVRTPGLEVDDLSASSSPPPFWTRNRSGENASGSSQTSWSRPIASQDQGFQIIVGDVDLEVVELLDTEEHVEEVLFVVAGHMPVRAANVLMDDLAADLAEVDEAGTEAAAEGSSSGKKSPTLNPVNRVLHCTSTNTAANRSPEDHTAEHVIGQVQAGTRSGSETATELLGRRGAHGYATPNPAEQGTTTSPTGSTSKGRKAPCGGTLTCPSSGQLFMAS